MRCVGGGAGSAATSLNVSGGWPNDGWGLPMKTDAAVRHDSNVDGT